jgi:acyl dehydratase
MTPGTPLYLEDLKVGQSFRSGSVRVELEAIKTFAAQFDPQPFHLDEEAAKTSLFGRLVASGWYTASLTMRITVDSDFKIAGGAIGLGVDEIRWPRPVYPGDELHVESEILELRPSRSNPERGIVKMRSATINQNGEVVMQQTTNLIVPRGPAQESA